MILEKIHKDLYSKGISNRKLADMFDTSHSTINDMLSGKRDFDFSIYTGILNLLYPDNHQLIKNEVYDFCDSTKRKNNLPLELEYTNLTGELELMKVLIEKGKISDNKTNRDFCSVYELLHLRNAEKKSKEEYLQEVRNIVKNTSTKKVSGEIKVLLEFALIYAFFDLGEYEIVHEYTKRLEPLINEEVTNKYFLYTLCLRKKEMIASCLHKDNKLEECRKLCKEIIDSDKNHFPLTKAIAYGLIGESYILTDFEQSKHFLERSLQCIENPCNEKMKYRYLKVKNTLDFLHIHWKVNLDKINPVDPLELAYLYIQKGDKEKAKVLLKEIEEKSPNVSPFWMYYWGIAADDREMLKKSFFEFLRKKNPYYAKLPQDKL
ncbi:AimR family lysis-lysogeny pheromone receptor [Bacillus cereus]|uniref:AimR family lysis-lysogeny pheromone receptor n=1 Tax=Bacillus cereus group sp. BfR-BA-01351 TaxID=2920314 RepID=UPI001F590C73|nr:AimR family lysis-lysogeny pheromone receptor [Bacillus cereus group sp. BfR-BA-01351]MEB9975287.1 AimR family lysis-lysogeny pheromone receptor [Bacillus cereus]